MLAGKDIGLTEALMVSGVGIIVVMAELALLAVLVFLLSRFVSAMVNKKPKTKFDNTTSEVVAKASLVPAAATNITSHVELHRVDEQTAATIMAIVSHQTGVALEHLDFKSIKLPETPLDLINVDEPTAATLMAIVSHQTGIPLERLEFKSIKLIEE